jgi:hypothetical protein
MDTTASSTTALIMVMSDAASESSASAATACIHGAASVSRSVIGDGMALMSVFGVCNNSMTFSEGAWDMGGMMHREVWHGREARGRLVGGAQCMCYYYFPCVIIAARTIVWRQLVGRMYRNTSPMPRSTVCHGHTHLDGLDKGQAEVRLHCPCTVLAFDAPRWTQEIPGTGGEW